MRVFKTRQFARWATKVQLSDPALLATANELNRGVIHAQLGAGLVKQRVALSGGGKRGGARVLVALSLGKRIIYLYGFAKNQRATITPIELRALKLLARNLLGLSLSKLSRAVDAGVLVEVRDPNNGKKDS